MFKVIKILSLIFFISVITCSILFFNVFINLKNIYFSVIDGKANLELSLEASVQKDFQQAYASSKKALLDFQKASNSAVRINDNFVLKNIPFLNNSFYDLSHLIKAGLSISQASSKITSIAFELEKLLADNKKFDDLKIEDKEKFIAQVYEGIPELNGIKANIDLSIYNLAKVSDKSLFGLASPKLNELKSALKSVKTTFSTLLPIAEMLPEIAGYPEQSSFLLILQNKDELRPTGGFIGTYGFLQTKSSEIKRLETHDIYHLDMPVKDRISILPPEAIRKYIGTDKWFLRDANWDPDWSKTAKTIETMYLLENSKLDKPDEIKVFNGVIAISPDFIIDLLSYLGPIEVNGEIYDKDNFLRLLQYKVEREYIQLGISEWNRKEEVGEIMKKMKEKLFNLPAEKLLEIGSIISSSVEKKDLLFYFKDKSLEETAKENNFAGNINNTEDDFLMLVDANLAAFKTDAVMGKNINYSLEESVAGLFAKVEINYAHRGDFDWRTTRYRSYTRLIVPKGSQLINSSGSSDGEILTKEESEKTFFEAFISVEPGDIGSLVFEYKLPDEIAQKIKTDKNYKLNIQRQPGSNIEELNISLNFDSILKSYKPIGFSIEKISESELKWKTNLNTDKELTASFQ